jgi:hypothetical protein
MPSRIVRAALTTDIQGDDETMLDRSMPNIPASDRVGEQAQRPPVVKPHRLFLGAQHVDRLRNHFHVRVSVGVTAS